MGAGFAGLGVCGTAVDLGSLGPAWSRLGGTLKRPWRRSTTHTMIIPLNNVAITAFPVIAQITPLLENRSLVPARPRRPIRSATRDSFKRRAA